MVDAVLSRLDIFKEALSRPGLSLKGLSPLAQALEKDSQHLDSLAKSMPADSSLRPVVEETAALSWTESYKFNWGDYLEAGDPEIFLHDGPPVNQLTDLRLHSPACMWSTAKQGGQPRSIRCAGGWG